MNPAPGHWFFDLDGTLMDTAGDVVGAWKRTIADLGLECPGFDEVFRMGPSINDIARVLFPGRADIDSLIAAIRSRFAENYDKGGFPTTVPYPGVEAWLERLKASGAKIYIASNKRLAPTVMLVRKTGWENLLDGVYTSDMHPPEVLKKPVFLARALRELGIEGKDAVMVGDTAGDIEAGKANAMHTVGVSWGYASDPHELDMADEVIDHA